jgi:hypothetical protein
MDAVAARYTAAGKLRVVVPESKLEKTEHGLVPKGEGWFVLNMRDAVREPTVYRDGWLPE